MKPIVNYVWKALTEQFEEYKKRDSHISLNIKLKDQFLTQFENQYVDICKSYMKEGIEDLDRHKQAALIAAVLSQIHPISHNKIDKTHVFLGNEAIGMSIALSYMADSLNERIVACNAGQPIKCYYMPDALSCDTPYFEVLYRNLFYGRNKGLHEAYILELANTFFLFEQLTLEKEKIDISKLKE